MSLAVGDLVHGSTALLTPILFILLVNFGDFRAKAHDLVLENSEMIHIVRIYQLAEKWSEDVKNKQFQDFEARGLASCTGLPLAARSCSLLKVDPQVLQRHPVMGVRAAFASLIRVGLNDNPSSPPHCRHRRLAKVPLFLNQLSKCQRWGIEDSHSGRNAQSGTPSISLQELNALRLQTFWAFYDFELDCLAFLEALESRRLNRGEVDEYVLSTGAA